MQTVEEFQKILDQNKISPLHTNHLWPHEPINMMITCELGEPVYALSVSPEYYERHKDLTGQVWFLFYPNDVIVIAFRMVKTPGYTKFNDRIQSLLTVRMGNLGQVFVQGYERAAYQIKPTVAQIALEWLMDALERDEKNFK